MAWALSQIFVASTVSHEWVNEKLHLLRCLRTRIFLGLCAIDAGGDAQPRHGRVAHSRRNFVLRD